MFSYKVNRKVKPMMNPKSLPMARWFPVLTVMLLVGAGTVARGGDVASWTFDQAGHNQVLATDSINGFKVVAYNNPNRAGIVVDGGSACVRLRNHGLGDADGVVLVVDNDPRLTGHADGADGYDSLTIEAQVKLDHLDGQAQIVRKTDGNKGYELYILKDGRVGLHVTGAKGNATFASKTRIAADGKWHSIQGTYVSYRDPYNAQLVVDGVVSRRTRGVGNLIDTSGPLTIGGFIRNEKSIGQRLDGWIRNVRITTNRTDLLDASGVGIDHVEPTGAHLMGQPGFVSAEFIVDPLPTPECHAATLAQAPDGSIIADWFGGTCEGHPDVGIWQSRLTESGWSYPEQVVDRHITDGSKGSVFNPVLFQYPNGPTLLFYLSGPLGSAEGNLIISRDGGRSWSANQKLPADHRGATKNKPVLLEDGTLVCPDNTDTLVFHRTKDHGKTWLETGVAPDPQKFGAIQPTILKHPGGRLQALGRSHCGWIVSTWSEDGGKTWTPLERLDVPNNYSGIDAAAMKDGRFVLVCNPVGIPEGRWGGPRTPLSVLMSDDGMNWKLAVTLEDEPGEYSYPSVVQAADGKVHVVYTWHRLRVKHAVIDPQAVELKDLK